MLQGLFGNKNIQRILLFLFVNDKCYGAQLSRLLTTPLTSLQNGLARLEKGGIITSYSEGKNKIYQLNSTFPLLPELEQLLKKTYTLLSPQEKKLYSLVCQENVERRDQHASLLLFWDKLKTVKYFTLEAKSRSNDPQGWNGKGRGEVVVSKLSESVLVFHERGSWIVSHGVGIDFSNTFRWTLDRRSSLISLEHLRLGPDQPVFLFHLAATGNQILASVDSHLCEEDAYLATVPWDRHGIRLNWRVIGPRKNEEMQYKYSY